MLKKQRNFEWDENKNLTNQQKHKIDFNDAINVFEDNDKMTFEDKRNDYEEVRWQVVGKMYDLIIFLVYTLRGENIRIISARRAKFKEREIYKMNSKNEN